MYPGHRSVEARTQNVKETRVKRTRRGSSPLLALLICGLLVGCDGQPSPNQTTSASPDNGQSLPRAPKSLTLAVQREPTAFADFTSVGGGTSGGAVNAQLIPHDGLVTEFQEERYRPRLAVEMPSIEKGTWRLNADDTMDVT